MPNGKSGEARGGELVEAAAHGDRLCPIFPGERGTCLTRGDQPGQQIGPARVNDVQSLHAGIRGQPAAIKVERQVHGRRCTTGMVKRR
ncbi:hypothetical protein [Novosphingobium sp. 9U]|uniref:hypothetical protein n=1 Tax=Novosphingobium sp. 9U TaxID=2653158 RepID=UPI001358A8DE|nr:hypothetical protein [Novosphingobium sp. 9U]